MNLFSLSPDLNPDEQVGGQIKRIIKNAIGKKVIKNKNQLWKEIRKAYKELSNDRQFFINLVKSMPNRLLETRNAQGGHTKY